MAETKNVELVNKIVALCKRRGFYVTLKKTGSQVIIVNGDLAVTGSFSYC